MSMKLRTGFLIPGLLSLVLSNPVAVIGVDSGNSDGGQRFRLSSTTFENNATLPLSMIATFPSTSNPNLNACTVDGSRGGNQTPELSWTGAPKGTRSFVMIMYDVTASFTHWGMYNISPMATELPANAGVSGSTFGTQVANDYGIGDLSYDGPCPPTSLSPLVHRYVFTVYALDTTLPKLPTFGQFLPGSEALYHALIAAGRGGHILASASISGIYSAAAPPGAPSE
jgi:Raf kinase inhibitor-like YbhB/YbcL family protein